MNAMAWAILILTLGLIAVTATIAFAALQAVT